MNYIFSIRMAFLVLHKIILFVWTNVVFEKKYCLESINYFEVSRHLFAIL